jgi:hypothetical protein
LATLEKIARGSVIKGILPDGMVTVADVRWIGTVLKSEANAVVRLWHG